MRTCIFCGAIADSNEDIWPTWMHKNIRQNVSGATVMQVVRINKNGTIQRLTWKDKKAAVRVKIVCSQCNNGWMSDLENESSPILSPMMNDTAMTLTSSQQFIIASWATKISMIFDAMDAVKGDTFFDSLDRSHFRDRLTPPVDFTNIWLGRYSGYAYNRWTQHRTLVSMSGIPHKNNIITMVFGRLVLQFLSLKWFTHKEGLATVNVKVKDGPFDWDDATIQIWPHSLLSVRWPPAMSFDDVKCHPQAFADRLGGKLAVR